MRVTVSDIQIKVTENASVTLFMRPPGCPIALPWTSHFSNVNKPNGFVDTQGVGPFASWEHTHTFVEEVSTVCIHDSVRFSVPGWFFGDYLIAPFVKRQLAETFAFREARLTERLGKR